MTQILLFRHLRLALAALVLLMASAICLYQHHFVVIATQPATYEAPFHHRCGLLFLLCTGWFALEATYALRLQKPRA